MSNEEKSELSKIYAYLGLDSVDERLKLKRDTMKKVIFYGFKWRKGKKSEWISKFATRTCISTRRMRENYVEPLIDDGIFKQSGNDVIEFAGLPDNAVVIKIPESEYGQHPCWNCGKVIPTNMNFCSKLCAKEYRDKRKKT